MFLTRGPLQYWLTAELLTLAPDGYEVQVLALNKSIPGPTIEANWGDEIVIHVTNEIPDNG
jgi:FtsP/CotA-like multicopper oxidase with cupredoxin domain